MLWFAIQLIPLLLGAMVAGVVVGWLIWARSLRKAREVHRSDVAVLRTQIASLGDESRRLQQRFGGLANELDGSRLEVQRQLDELANTREAFRMSQANLTTAEYEISQFANIRSESQAELDRLNQQTASLRTEFDGVKQQLDIVHNEVARLNASLELSVESSVADSKTARLEIETAQVALGASEQSLDVSQRELTASQHDLVLTRRDLDDLRNKLVELELNHQTTRGEALATQTSMKSDAESAIGTLRRLWAKAESERAMAEQQLGASKRAVGVLQSQQVELRNGFVSSLQHLDAAKQHALTELAVAHGQLSETNVEAAKREATMRTEFERRATTLTEAHRLAIDHWRRDLHQRFDEIETQKMNLTIRDKRVNELERQLSTVGNEVRAQTQFQLRSESAELLATRERQLGVDHAQNIDDLHTLHKHRESELVSQVAAVDGRLVEARSSADRLETHLAQALSERNAAQVAVGSMQVEAATKDTIIEGLASQVEALETRVAEVQTDVERVSFERHGLEEERNRLLDALATVEVEREVEREVDRVEARRVIGSLEHDNAGLSEERALLRSQLSASQGGLAELQAELAGLLDERDVLQADQAGLLDEQAELVAQVEALGARLVEVLSDVERVSFERHGLEEERDRLVEVLRLAEVDRDVERVAAQRVIASLEHDNAGLSDERVVLRSELANLEVERQRNVSQAQLLDARLAEVLSDVERVSFERHGLEGERDRLVETLTGLKIEAATQREAQQAEQAELQQVITLLTEERVSLRSALTDLNGERESLAVRFADVNEQNELLLNDNAAVEKSRVELHLAHEAVNQLLESTVETRDTALREVLSSRIALSHLDSRLQESATNVEQQEIVVTKLHEQLVVLENTVKENDRQLLAAHDQDRVQQRIILDTIRRNEVSEAQQARDNRLVTERLLKTEDALFAMSTEAGGWKREVVQLRQLFEVAQAKSGRTSLNVSTSLLAVDSSSATPGAPRRIRPSKPTAQTNVGQPSRGLTQAPGTERQSEAATTGAGDNLQRIEGIGPKIEAALKAAGVSSFVRLEAASPSQLRDALASAGLTFAPSLVGWSKQAAYLVAGDEEGFLRFTEMLVAGRDERGLQG